MGEMEQELPANQQGLHHMARHNARLLRRFERCVRPIKDYFDCSFVVMDCVNRHGQVWLMSSDQAVMEYYLLTADGFKHDPVFRDPTLWLPQVFVWPKSSNGHFQDRLNQGFHQHFHIHSAVTFFFQEFDRFYAIGLATTHPRHDVVNHALREQPMMDNLRRFMLQTMQRDIQTLEQQWFPAATYVGSDYHLPMMMPGKPETERLQFLLDTGQIERSDLTLFQIRLTARERQCAYWYLQGYGMDQLGSILGFGAVAGRNQIHRIRHHLGAKNKDDLIKKLKRLELMGYFKQFDQFVDRPKIGARP